jgi:aspartyl/asparaginyl beta-hydroxylase (cupin superfamily)
LYNLAGLLNPLFDISVGGARRPVFFDIDQTAPTLRRLDAACPMIAATLDHVLSVVERLPAYHMIDRDVIYSSGRQQRDSRWGVFMLTCFGKEPEAARQLCPELLTLLRTIPNLYQAFFSVLEPGKSIPAHVGPSRVYLRYHLGLRVPTTATPVMRVKDQIYSWKNGESVLFDDSWKHEIINHCQETRAILIVDLERRLPRALRAVAWFQRKTAAIHYARRIVAAANGQFSAELLRAEGFVEGQGATPDRG